MGRYTGRRTDSAAGNAAATTGMGTAAGNATATTGLGTAAGNAAATTGMGRAAVLGTSGTEKPIVIIKTVSGNIADSSFDWPWRAYLLAIWRPVAGLF